MSGAVPLFPVYAFMAWTRVTLPLLDHFMYLADGGSKHVDLKRWCLSRKLHDITFHKTCNFSPTAVFSNVMDTNVFRVPLQ